MNNPHKSASTNDKFCIPNLVIFTTLVLTLVSFSTSLNLWPIPKYDMFARLLHVNEQEFVLPFGVRDDGSEFSMNHSSMIVPFQRGLIAKILQSVVGPERNFSNLEDAGQFLLKNYNRRHRSQIHALRFYSFKGLFSSGKQYDETRADAEFLYEVHR